MGDRNADLCVVLDVLHKEVGVGLSPIAGGAVRSSDAAKVATI